MRFLESSVGRKMVMSLTGLMMVFFVVIHLLGNSSVFMGPEGINAYAARLHSFAPVMWLFRLFMVIMVSLHVFYGIRLTLENNAAKPRGYAVSRSLRATFASKSMIWTGLAIAVFLVYHLLHFTLQITNPEISAGRNMDTLGRPDVFTMVVLSFQKVLISLVYIISMVALGLHLIHGIQSLFQTAGLNSEGTFPVLTRAGKIAAIVFSLGYISIPVVVLTRIVRP